MSAIQQMMVAYAGVGSWTWTARESSRNWRAITSSSDGTKLAAVAYNGQIYTGVYA